MFLFLKKRQEAHRQGKDGQRVTDHQYAHPPFDQCRCITADREFIRRAGRIRERDEQASDRHIPAMDDDSHHCRSGAHHSQGGILAEAEKKGEKMPVIDAMIAASAIINDLTVATRNIGDYKNCEVAVINLWDQDKK